jgi:transposase-like protein
MTKPTGKRTEASGPGYRRTEGKSTRALNAERALVKTENASGGRPRLAIEPRDLAQIEQFGALGLTQAEIAPLLGVSSTTFENWLRQYPEVYESWKRGKSKGLAVAGKALHDKVKSGDVTAIIWYEKTRGRRSDRIEIVREDDYNTITSTISQLSVEQLQRIADGESPIDVLGNDTSTPVEDPGSGETPALGAASSPERD